MSSKKRVGSVLYNCTKKKSTLDNWLRQYTHCCEDIPKTGYDSFPESIKPKRSGSIFTGTLQNPIFFRIKRVIFREPFSCCAILLVDCPQLCANGITVKGKFPEPCTTMSTDDDPDTMISSAEELAQHFRIGRVWASVSLTIRKERGYTNYCVDNDSAFCTPFDIFEFVKGYDRDNIQNLTVPFLLKLRSHSINVETFQRDPLGSIIALPRKDDHTRFGQLNNNICQTDIQTTNQYRG